MGRAHKETNTYRFQNFSERMKLMHIDVVHQVRKRKEDDLEEQSTYFGEALAKWMDLNCTQHFADFNEDMSKYPCTSFVQLVHHAEDIVATLKKHLLVKGTLALEPLLDLVVQMGRDMGPDFYMHFKELFEILVKLLNVNAKDPDALEKVFVTMAFLYKFLWRYLVQNIETVYGYFSSLLTEDNKEYIQRFAAESFAFLMRKVKDQDALLTFLFKDLKQNPEKTEGLGQLLFEVVKGVKEHFHSISDQMFGLVLMKLGTQSWKEETGQLPVDLVEETVGRLMQACADYASKEHAGQMWTTLLNTVTEVHKSCIGNKNGKAEERVEHVHHLCRLLRMTDIWLKHDKGRIVSDPSAVAKVISAMLKELPEGDLAVTLASDLLTMASSLLLNSGDCLSVETTARLMSQVFATDFSLEEMKQFSLTMLQSPLFEKDVLPGLLSYTSHHFDTVKDTVKKEMLALLADIVLQKSSIPEDGSQLGSLQKYPLDFGRAQRGRKSTLIQYMQLLLDLDKNLAAEQLSRTEGLSELMSALVCLPQVGTVDSSVCAKGIVTAWDQLKTALLQVSPDHRDMVLFVMRQAIISLLVLKNDVSVPELLPAVDVITLLKSHPSNFFVLHAADLYLTLMSDLDKDDFLTPDLLVELYPLLELNLVSGSHKVRQSTLHLLTLFPVSIPVPMQQDNKAEEDPWTIFTVALAAEKVPLSMRDYRQRLMYLRKLDHNIVHAIMPAGPFSKMPMMYLMGTLLCPMTLLWDPVCELIAGHAHGLNREEFWEPFFQQLTVAATKAVETPVSHEDAADPATLLEQWVLKEKTSERSPDFTSFRNFLWKAMSLFPDKCEPKSRDFVPLLFTFLQKEYYLVDVSLAPSQSIKVDNTGDEEDEDDQDEEEENHEDNQEDNQEENRGENTPRKRAHSSPKKVAGKAGRKYGLQSLLVHLELFAKIQNPRALYREAELRDIFFQFLEHKNSKVQKMAFKCIMTYKYKFLTPYRENFERLLDDKTFKTEVVQFSVDEESTEIKPEHRQDLLPVLMRILYGKMLSKAGTETAGKRRSDVRRSIVFRFLGGCAASEMQYFLDLVFGPFKHLLTDDPLKMVKEIASIDIRNVVPPKRMKGVLGAVLVVTEKLGNLLEDNARSILHLLLGVAATCAACLKQRDVIKPSAASTLKSVRQMAFNRLIQFFGEFDKFEYTEQESDAILEAFVWPQLDRLSLESKMQPSLLLRLLQCWCQDPKYFHLLTKEAPSGKITPLSAMFSLLTAPGVGRPVSTMILKSVESLVEGEEDHEEEPPQKRRRTAKKSRVSQGPLMVRPHIPALLTFLEEAVKSLGSQLEKNRKTGATKETLLELKILARVSVFIEDEDQSVRLCSLLVPFLSGTISLQQELEESTLESVLNLMKMVKEPRPFYRSMLPLFIGVERRQSRIVLCQILKVIGSKVPELEDIADIVEKLNAWNPKQAEEPDYTVRLETFRQVIQQLKDWTELNVDSLLALIYNCCFFIKSFEDLSLRDNSTLCLVTLVQRFKALNSDPALYKEIIAGTLLVHVKKGLRCKQEAARHEFLAVLQALVLAFPEQREFLGLSGLHDTDLESDFFENIKHIQMHRQAKALRRLSHYLHSHKLRADQHMGFFVPILYGYIFDKRLAKSGKILDATVDLTCMICRQLPWENYYMLLRLYLSHLPRHLDMQRIIVKVIVSILDGFHFDLSQSQFKFSNKPKLNQQSTDGKKGTEETEDSSKTLPEVMVVDTEKTPEEEQLAEEALSSLEAMATKPEEEGEGGGGSKAAEFSAERKDLCPPGLATRIHRMVLQSMIPQLHKTLTEKVKSDEIHKLAQSKYAEDEEILRVPIAMAMIKLLQKLPDGALKYKLPGIVLRVCNFLKSRAQDIRMTARDTLVKAVQSIGPNYLPFIIKEMRAVLTRGYQLHVLSFSVHFLLKSIATTLKPGNLDPALKDLQAIFQEELFGAVSEEKSVEGITSKLFEAKTIKGYLAYEIMAQLISPDRLGALVHPLKTTLEGTHSQRTANKVRLALQHINTGMLKNSAVTLKDMMLFVHSLTHDNLPLLKEQKETQGSDAKEEAKPQKPESCLLLAKALPRGGAKPKMNKKTTLDVLVEFGLVLLHSCLKSSTLKSNNAEHLSFLEPLVPSLVKCLSLKYVRVNSAALRCFEWLLTFPLASLKEKIKVVAKQLFILLKNYATAGAAKGDNQELVFMCFRTVTVLVRDVKYYKLTTEHLQVLLTFCEEDIHDHTRQSTAFSVLKAILKRQLNVPELHELLTSVETMSITAEAHHLRAQCREVVMQYLKDYPLGKKMEKHFQFYIRQLTYDHEDGRMSALKLLRAVFSSFDETILQKYSGLFFVPLSTTLFTDESVACREMASQTIKTLLERIDITSRDTLFSLVLKWIEDNKLTLWSVAVQLCGLFVEVETHKFTTHRPDIFPLLLEKDLSSEAESSEHEQDQFLFHMMTLIKKVLLAVDITRLSAWTDVSKLLDYVQSHMLDNHSWVRLLTCQIMAQVFSSVGQDNVTSYLSTHKARELVYSFCTQLQSPLLDEKLAFEITKNMVFIAKAYHTSDTEDKNAITVLWLTRRLMKEANYEKINTPQVTLKRNHVFKWVAAVSQQFEAGAVTSFLPTVLPALQREAEDIGKDEALKQLAQEVMDWLKKKCGVEAFSSVYASAQKARLDKKEKRKQKRAVASVNNPEVSAAKRIKKNKNRKKIVHEDRLRRTKKTKLSVYEHKN
ncbi:small subunit processome component 20 homolog [Littorina saxatilis]|uniref:Small subunit processome component 20 homolog n=1 Tax=Littorina saxatilis TaxID=31220 RepID=A0AAN9BM75_9CAEN